MSSCSYRPIRYSIDTRQSARPLIIQMSKSPVVIEYVHDMLYNAVWQYFSSVGYTLVDSLSGSHTAAPCTLKTIIRNLDNVDTLISPDVQPYGHKVMALVQWMLSDEDGVVIGQGQEVAQGWVYKPCDPIFNRDFMMFQYRILLEQIPPLIDHHVRVLLGQYSAQRPS